MDRIEEHEERSLSHERIRAAFLLFIDIIRGISL